MNTKSFNVVSGVVIVVLVSTFLYFIILIKNAKRPITETNTMQEVIQPITNKSLITEQLDRNTEIEIKNNDTCNPNDSNVTEELNFLKKYEGETLSTPAGDFLVVEALKTEEEWIRKVPWNVCDNPVVYIEKRPTVKEGFNKVFYKGNIYQVPIGSIPDYNSHNKISFLNNSVEKKYKFSPISKNSVKHIGDATVYIAKRESVDDYPKTMLVENEEIVSSDYDYVGYANGWHDSFILYKGALAYIVANKPAYNFVNSLPMRNADVKYQIIWKNKPVTDFYDGIYGLNVINDKLGCTALENGKTFIIYDGKKYGDKYVKSGNVMDAGDGKMAYIGVAEDGNWYVVRDDKEIFNFKPWVFYPTRDEDNFGDIAFVNSKLAIAVSNENYSESYILYGEHKLEGVSGSLKNIGNKLVIDQGDYRILIEK